MANEVAFATLEGTMGHDYLILAEAALSARYAHDNLRDLVLTRDISSLTTDTVRFPKRPAVTAGALTDGVNLTNFTAYQPSQSPATVSEVGLMFLLTDLGRSGSIVNDLELAMAGGEAVMEKMTTDIAALGSGFSNSVGSTGVDLTEANVQSAVLQLLGNKAQGSTYAVFHQQQWIDLINDIGTQAPAFTGGGDVSNTNSLMPTTGNGGVQSPIYGIDTIRVNPLVPTANAGADRLGFFGIAGRTIGGAVKWFIRPEMQRDASYRGVEVVVTACYAFIEVEDETGVGVLSDA